MNFECFFLLRFSDPEEDKHDISVEEKVMKRRNASVTASAKVDLSLRTTIYEDLEAPEQVEVRVRVGIRWANKRMSNWRPLTKCIRTTAPCDDDQL